MRSEDAASLMPVGRGRRVLSATIAPRFDNPEGGGHGCPPFFDRARMASRKIPEQVNRRICCVGEAFSFGYFSLGQQRKVTRSPAGERKHCFCSCSPQAMLRRLRTLSSAGAAEFISFGGRQKKRNQRKTSPRHVRSPRRHVQRDFPTRHPASVGKRRPSMGGALRVGDRPDSSFRWKDKANVQSGTTRSEAQAKAKLAPATFGASRPHC